MWHDAKELVVMIYAITENFPGEERFGLTAQLRRASVSVSSNIAEGAGRKTDKDKANFYTMAYGSLVEVLNQLLISEALQFIITEQLRAIRFQVEKVSNKLNSLRKSLHIG